MGLATPFATPRRGNRLPRRAFDRGRRLALAAREQGRPAAAGFGALRHGQQGALTRRRELAGGPISHALRGASSTSARASTERLVLRLRRRRLQPRPGSLDPQAAVGEDLEYAVTQPPHGAHEALLAVDRPPPGRSPAAGPMMHPPSLGPPGSAASARSLSDSPLRSKRCASRTGRFGMASAIVGLPKGSAALRIAGPNPLQFFAVVSTLYEGSVG